MDSLLGGFSGRIGEPEGTGRLLNTPKVPEDVQQYVQDQIANISTGGGVTAWVRANAAGTIIASSGVSSVSRTAEGIYQVTLSSSIASEAYGVVVTPSSEAGNGGDGIYSYKAFSNFEVSQTDTTDTFMFAHEAATDDFYVWGTNTDDAWVHDGAIATFDSTTPTQVDASADPIRAPQYSGVLSKDGLYMWFSGDTTPYPVRCMNTQTQVMTDFGTTSDSIIVAADETGGTPHVYILENSSTMKRYTPSIGGASLGTADWSMTLDVLGNDLPGEWDNDGHIWFLQATKFWEVTAATGAKVSHSYPAATTTPSASAGGTCRAVFDPVRKRFYAILTQPAGTSWLYEYSGWADIPTADSGTWNLLATFVSGAASGRMIYYDTTSDVLFMVSGTDQNATRWVGDPKTKLDTVSILDTTPDNSYIDYDINSAYGMLYYDSRGYGYLGATKGGNYYLLRIDYQGSEIANGTGGSVISSVLIGMYEITGNNTFLAQLFRSQSPVIRADGEFTAVVTS